MTKINQRENSVGYYYDLPKVGRAQLSRKYYDNDTRPIYSSCQKCVPANVVHLSQNGGSIGGQCFQNLVRFIAPLGKTQLMAVIVLFVMNHFKKNFLGKSSKQSGGGYNYVDMAGKALAPLGKNALVVVAALLLLNYFTKNRSGKMKGGDNTKFMKKLVELLKSKHNKKQKGGNILANLNKIIAPMGGNMFVATALLLLLNNLFEDKHDRKQKGGVNLICALRQLVMPMGINSFLTTLGLISLTRIRKQKGGDCGCGGILNVGKQSGGVYGCKNCGCGDNALEVVGDKALDYSLDLKQFGCKIPEWGYNLQVNGPDGQTKCI